MVSFAGAAVAHVLQQAAALAHNPQKAPMRQHDAGAGIRSIGGFCGPKIFC